MTQLPVFLMGPERKIFHICQPPHIFHFSISVDIRGAFIQLVLMLLPGSGDNFMQSPTNQAGSCCLLAHPCWHRLLLNRALTCINPSFLSSIPGGLVGPEWAPACSEVMGIQGMELFAIGVVIILFMAVLKQFGILEPMSSFEGNGPPAAFAG